MDIKAQINNLVAQWIENSPTKLSSHDLVTKIIELQPDWLPTPIFNPQKKYQKGERLFHASNKIEDWFTIEEVFENMICVKFDSGEKMNLSHNRNLDIRFPVSLIEYLLNQIEGKFPIEDDEDILEQVSEKYGINYFYHIGDDENIIKQVSEKYGINCFYRIDHINNLHGILKDGYFCRNEKRWNKDISSPEVQAGRQDKAVPCSPGKTLHDFVPVFIAPKSPMLSAKRDEQENIIYCHISLKVIKLPGVLFSDGNSRSNSTRFYTDIVDLEKLDWEILKSRYWGDDNETVHKENKRKRSAELLIPGCLPKDYIESISVINKITLDKVVTILKNLEAKIPIRINPDLYFPNSTTQVDFETEFDPTELEIGELFFKDWDHLEFPPD
jgi:hypothetical protein